MRLFIAEKPNLAKAIANGLGNGRTESGCIRCGKDVVTWCFGHMLELAWPQDYSPEYAQWRREHLPIIPSEWKYHVKKDAAKQLAVIGSLLREADSVVNAGDPDREGQLLVDEVLEHFSYHGPVARIWLPSLDDKSVRIALNGIRDNAPYAPLRDAARARSLADWLVGINATRAMTIKGREGGRSEVLSLGRVQTPTLALVVARDREITHFKPADYFVLKASLVHTAGEITATFVPSETQAGLDASGRLVDFTQVAAVLERVNGVEGLVTESLRENKSKAAPLPHSLSSLQKAASSRFSMSAQEVLDTAQSLYERKLTTYPRTDARVLSTAVAKEIGRNIGGLKSYPALSAEASQVLESGSFKGIAKTRYVNDKLITDHYAIIPTGQGFGALRSLAPASARVYELIVRRFLSIFYPPAVYPPVSRGCVMKKERFFSSFRVLAEEGYLKVAGIPGQKRGKQEETAGEANGEANDSADSGKDDPAALFAAVKSLKKGMTLPVSSLDIKEGKTSPPKRYNSGSLILAMENAGQLIEDEELREQIKSCGIGTSATRGEILKKLFNNKYLALNKKTQIVTPTLQGEMIYDVVDHSIRSLLNPELTASWEKGLNYVAEGEITSEEYMEKLEHFIKTRTDGVLGLNNQYQLRSCYDRAAAFYKTKNKKPEGGNGAKKK